MGMLERRGRGGLAAMWVTLGMASVGAAQSNVRPIPELARAPRPAKATASRATVREAAHSRAETRYGRVMSDPLWTGAEPESPPSRWRPLDAQSSYSYFRGEPRALPESRSSFELELDAKHRTAADLEGTNGELTFQRAGWTGAFRESLDDDRQLELRVRTEATFYDFGGMPSLPGGSSDPFNDLYSTGVGISYLSRHSERVSWFVGSEIELSGEDDASVGDALALGALGGVRVDVDDSFDVSMGIAARSRFEDDAWVIPFLGFTWEPREGTRLTVEGPEVSLTQDLGDRFQLEFVGRYGFRQYRLNEKGPLNGGAFQDEEIDLEATLAFRPNDTARLHLTGGATIWQELSFYDGSGVKLGEVETGVAPYIGFGLKLSF